MLGPHAHWIPRGAHDPVHVPSFLLPFQMFTMLIAVLVFSIRIARTASRLLASPASSRDWPAAARAVSGSVHPFMCQVELARFPFGFMITRGGLSGSLHSLEWPCDWPGCRAGADRFLLKFLR